MKYRRGGSWSLPLWDMKCDDEFGFGPILGQQKTSVYTKPWSSDKETNMRFQTFVADTDNLLLATDTNNKIHALHSFKVAGGTLLLPTT
jgi:hypothetical protein